METEETIQDNEIFSVMKLLYIRRNIRPKG